MGRHRLTGQQRVDEVRPGPVMHLLDEPVLDRIGRDVPASQRHMIGVVAVPGVVLSTPRKLVAIHLGILLVLADTDDDHLVLGHDEEYRAAALLDRLVTVGDMKHCVTKALETGPSLGRRTVVYEDVRRDRKS